MSGRKFSIFCRFRGGLGSTKVGVLGGDAEGKVSCFDGSSPFWRLTCNMAAYIRAVSEGSCLSCSAPPTRVANAPIDNPLLATNGFSSCSTLHAYRRRCREGSELSRHKSSAAREALDAIRRYKKTTLCPVRM